MTSKAPSYMNDAESVAAKAFGTLEKQNSRQKPGPKPGLIKRDKMIGIKATENEKRLVDKAFDDIQAIFPKVTKAQAIPAALLLATRLLKSEQVKYQAELKSLIESIDEQNTDDAKNAK